MQTAVQVTREDESNLDLAAGLFQGRVSDRQGGATWLPLLGVCNYCVNDNALNDKWVSLSSEYHAFNKLTNNIRSMTRATAPSNTIL